MRLFLIFPLAFVAGMDGFILFAPYLLAVVIAGHLLARHKAARAAHRPATSAPPSPLAPLPAFAFALAR